MAAYRPIPIPAEMAGPSGESDQISIDGIAIELSLYHGKRDEEFDWHLYLRQDEPEWRRLRQFLRSRGIELRTRAVAEPYCELMVIDDWHRRSVTWPPWQATGQRKYDTADVTRVWRLVKDDSQHVAHDLAAEPADEPGETADLSDFSLLVQHGGRVYMQGVAVIDPAHDSSPDNLEIHPPDSIAFAVDDTGRTVVARPGEPGWPSRHVRWRVAWFANSAHHRVNELSAVAQPRTTTWFLAPPGPPLPAGLPGNVLQPHISVDTTPIPLWDSKSETWYDQRGVSSVADAEISTDPRDNRRKVRAGATMRTPGDKGGLLVRDYVITVRPDDVVLATT